MANGLVLLPVGGFQRWQFGSRTGLMRTTCGFFIGKDPTQMHIHAAPRARQDDPVRRLREEKHRRRQLQ